LKGCYASGMNTFASRIVHWHGHHGRHDLPWQSTRDPYRIWLSEIMLQQTQVATVIPYFRRFVARFPDLPALAAAHEDEVLAVWSGLGYYSRARHLHAAARAIVAGHAGAFPATPAALMQLPGVGRSTAAAIAALASASTAPSWTATSNAYWRVMAESPAGPATGKSNPRYGRWLNPCCRARPSRLTHRA